jgi:hypothetical protein
MLHPGGVSRFAGLRRRNQRHGRAFCLVVYGNWKFFRIMRHRHLRPVRSSYRWRVNTKQPRTVRHLWYSPCTISVRVCDEPLEMCRLMVLLGNSQGAFVRAYLCNVCHVATHSCAPGVRRRRVFCCPSALMELQLLFWILFSVCWRHDCFRTFSFFLKLHLCQLQRYIPHRQRYVFRVLPVLCTRAVEFYCDVIANARSQVAAALARPHWDPM